MKLIHDLIGLVPVKIDKTEYEIRFTMSNGERFKLFHMQDCCEDVFIEDINGDLNLLLNRPILVSSERTQEDPNVESGTWTFFHIGNDRHTVVIRFYGSSNGYYSETADLFECDSDWDEIY